ncbi:ABC transporter permease [Jatrophihabitans telluris]|uniref:ABC transporter permease n=1 Tax=Jatrophihabitans telluris TaxID=2038343 RepID=A0ABY4QUG9_9ACTN|nr:ABC transporter permease [Jatrophihabitans telluris]UQX87100.1 ABC transporter permease [Jatrophihabitans telluris]
MWSTHHPLGTDPLGNDEFARVLAGGRISIEVALASNVVGLLLGGLLGMFAGYIGGWRGQLISSAVDLLQTFPSLVLSFVIAASLGPGEGNVIWSLSAVGVPVYARLARAHTLRLRSEDFVISAQLSGVSARRVIVTHIAPNLWLHLLTFSAAGLSGAIMFEASLSFVGLGVRPPAASWGNMIAQGQEYITTSPRLVVVPSVFLVLLVLSTTVLSDAIRGRATVR